MPKKQLPDEKEDRLLRLWLLAHRDHPEWAIEKIYLDILCEEFDGRDPGYPKKPDKPWPVEQRRSLSWFTQRIAKQWNGLKLPDVPKETIVKPWDENWGEDPGRIHILSVIFDLATEVAEYLPAYYQPAELESQFQFYGFPISVCNWACKLSQFFNLQSQDECLVLLHFAYVFAADEQYATEFEETMSFEDEGFKMLMQWHKRNQEPLVAEATSVEEDRVLLPIWEQSNRGDLIWAVAMHLRETYNRNLFMDQTDAEDQRERPWPRPSLIVHDPSIEIANQEQEGTEVVEEELLDGAYRVISMATTNQMIMPVDISGEEFIDPPPEIAEAFAETFAQARVRVAKEEAERTAGTGDAQNPLTQDAVLKLVSELLQDPGTLSRERATELGMDLVSTFDKILNRHEDEGENL